MFLGLIAFLTLAGSVVSSSFNEVQKPSFNEVQKPSFNEVRKPINISMLAGRYRSMNPMQNQWEVEDFRIHRFDKPGRPNLMAQFYLYRSRIIPPCPLKTDMLRFFLLAMAGETCGYFVPDQPILCRDGVYNQMAAGGTTHWQNPLNTKNYWSTCDTYPRAVEGEEQVPEEKKRWLKWRMIDLKEKSLPNPPESQPAHLREIPFKSAKLEVINGVPLKRYVSFSCSTAIMADNANELT
jgi:hypothetical protein